MILRMEARFWASSVRVQIMAKKKVPGLLHHKGKNLGYSISPATRKATYHGQWGLVATKQAYLRWCADILSEDVTPSIVPEHEPVVADLVNAMIKHSISYYRVPLALPRVRECGAPALRRCVGFVTVSSVPSGHALQRWCRVSFYRYERPG